MNNIGFLTFDNDYVVEVSPNVFDKMAEYTCLTVLGKRDYCERHGYTFYNYKTIEEKWSPEWSKVIYCLKHLKEHDWIFWSDADAMITNYNIKLESIIDNNFDVIVSNDIGGMNTGSFLIKNSRWSYDFLKKLYSLREEYENGNRSFRSNQPNQFTDQDAMVNLFNENWNNTKQHFKFIEKRIFNSYAMTRCDDWQYGDFILHMPGTFDRASKFKQFIPLIIK